MPTYDTAWFEPPAPLARVSLHNPDNNAALSDVPMLLDSGADVSLIPQNAVSHLGLELASDKGYELVGFAGGVSFAQAVTLDLVFMGRTFKGQFLVIDQEWGIIGRNILNAIGLVLDGPRLTWNEFKN